MIEKFFKLINNLPILSTLKMRIVLLISLGSLLLFGSVIFYSTYKARNNAIASIKQKIEIQTNEYASKIKIAFEKAVNSARILARSIESYSSIPVEKRRQFFNSALKNIIEKNEEFSSIWIVCEPNSIDNLDSVYKVDELKIKGRYIKTFYRNKDEIIEAQLNEKTEEELDFKDYYVLPKTTKQETVLSPYFSSARIKKNSEFLTNVIIPIMPDGVFIGAIGIELNLSVFQDIVNKKMLFENSYGMLLSNDGKIITNDNEKAIGKSFTELNSIVEKKFGIIKQVKQQKPFSVVCDLYDNGQEYYLLFTPIQIIDNNQAWAYATVVSNSSINNAAYTNLFDSVFLGIISFVLFVLLIWNAASRVSIPLLEIAKASEKLSFGDFNLGDTKHEERFSGSEMKSIVRSMNKLIEGRTRTAFFAKKIGQGNLEADFIPMSDRDLLGLSLLEMRKNLREAEQLEQKRQKEEQKQHWLNQGIAKFSDILRRYLENLNQLCYEVISNLIEYINANQGGLFIYNNENSDDIHLQLVASYAYNRQRFITKKIALGDGLVGACALEKKTIYLTNVPDNYIEISSGMGTAKPTAVLIVPLVINDDLFGVIEIASFKNLEPFEIEFVEKIAESIASSLLSAKINAQTQNLLEQFKRQSEIMAEKEKDLRKNVEDLRIAQEEAKIREAQMKSIFDALNTSFLVAEFDLKGKVLSMNNDYMRILKINTYNEISGKYIGDIFPFNQATINKLNDIWTSLQRGLIQKYDQAINFYDNEIWISQTFTPIFNDKNEPVKVLNIGTEITQVKTQEAKVRKLLIEAQDKAEQMAVQEMEMMNTLQEMEILHKEVIDKDEAIIHLQNENEKLTKTLSALQNTIEKRLLKSTQFENRLKSKIKELEQELLNYKNINRTKDNNHTTND